MLLYILILSLLSSIISYLLIRYWLNFTTEENRTSTAFFINLKLKWVVSGSHELQQWTCLSAFYLVTTYLISDDTCK